MRGSTVRILTSFVLASACDPSVADIDYAKVEEECFHTGGILGTSKCCEGVLDYAPTCGGDPCTCTDDTSWEILSCDCGTDACFDGSACVLHGT